MTSLTALLAWAALAAAALAVIEPRLRRPGWLAVQLLAVGWLAIVLDNPPGAMVLVAEVVALDLARGSALTPRGDFSAAFRRLLALLAAVVLALALSSRRLPTDLGAGAGSALVPGLIVAGITALFVNVETADGAERGLTTHVLIVLAAVAWTASIRSHSFVEAELALGLLVLVAVVGRLRLIARLPSWLALSAALLATALVLGATWFGPLPALGGFERGALVLAAGGLVLASTAWFLLPGLALMLATGSALLALTALLLVAEGLAVSGDGKPNLRWRWALVPGAMGFFVATTMAIPGGQVLTDRALALLVVAGSMALAGVLPFGIALFRWLEESPRQVAIITITVLFPGILALLVKAGPLLNSTHLSGRAGLMIAGFGVLTAALSGVYALWSEGWRQLAARSALGDMGLALVGLGTLDIHGLQGAALMLVTMALTRPLMLMLDDGETDGLVASVTRWVAALAAAGAPPTVGFAARMLIIGAAYRLHPWLGTATVLAIFAGIASSLRLLLPADRAANEQRATTARATTVVLAALVMACGLLPSVVLSVMWGLG